MSILITRSQTSVELAKLLGFNPENNEAYLNNYLWILDSQAQLSKGTTVQIASTLFAAKELTIKPSFKKTIQTFYKSDIKKVNFINEKETLDIINSFVNYKTKGLIKRLFYEGQIDGLSKYHILRWLFTKKLLHLFIIYNFLFWQAVQLFDTVALKHGGVSNWILQACHGKCHLFQRQLEIPVSTWGNRNADFLCGPKQKGTTHVFGHIKDL